MKNIAVFCGSKSGNNANFMQQAYELGKQLANNNCTLVYGGGSVGIMGAVANGVIENKGKAIGVIPEVLKEREVEHKTITTLHVATDMHSRKKLMYELCDAAIILPGGYGTLDELFEILTWNNLKIHEKKVIILNSDGFYNALLQHFDIMAKENFLYEDWQERIKVCDDIESTVALLK